MKNNWRQKLHLEPAQGWLNDPNGLCFFQDRYHVYFQYSPESALGKGPKCWGHWESKDFLHWHFTGTVLFPDHPADRNGVYSGCALVQDKTLYLFYTGNVKEEGDFDYITAGRGANVILVTTENGRDMSEKQVLLRNADYPANCSCHVRDPKVWEENGRYRMVLGARTRDDRGCVLFYTSDDRINWQFDKEVTLPDFGYMWECPDVFTLGEHRFLSASPQGLAHEETRFQNVYSSGYFRYDGETPSAFEEWDYGFDFYAPQTFETPDGRRILIGWMGIGDIPYTNPTAALGWQHCLTLPRELTVLPDGSIRQQPIRELVSLRQEKQTLTKGGTVRIRLPFELCLKTEEAFCLRFSEYLTLSRENGVCSLTFTDKEVAGGRTVRKVKTAACRSLRILADTSSLEIYINEGEKVLCSRFYPSDTEVSVSSQGAEGILYSLNGLSCY